MAESSNGSERLHIKDYRVIGVEHDGSDRWVGADVEVSTLPAGRFIVRIVTKQAFADERMRWSYEEAQSLTPEDFIDDDIERKPPYVFNDNVLTDEILEAKLRDRPVLSDFANSMWPVIEDADEV